MVVAMVFGGLAVLFFGMYQREVEKDLMPEGSEVIGKIVQAEVDVARRLNARLLWSQLENEAILYRKDTLRTGPASKVVVRLNNNSSIALGENTLVVLETENESLSLKLADGDVEFSGDVTVSLGGHTTLRAVDGTLRLKRDVNTGKDKVAAISGKAEVTSVDGVTIVEEGRVLVKGQEGAFKVSKESMSEAGLKDLGLKDIENLNSKNAEISAKLNKLEPRVLIAKDSKSKLVRLEWNAPKEASKYRLKIGGKDFSVVDAHFEITPSELAPLLGEKITVQALGSGVDGAEQVFKLEQSAKDQVSALGLMPVNQTPFDRSRILTSRKKLLLQWSNKEMQNKDFSHYNVSIQNKKGKIKEYRSDKAQYSMELSEAETYSWHVQPVYKTYGLGPKSPSTNFEVINGADLAAPTISPASEDN